MSFYERYSNKAQWFLNVYLFTGLVFWGAQPLFAESKNSSTEKGPRINASLQQPIRERMVPFSWGMSLEQVFISLEQEIEQAFAQNISDVAYNPSLQLIQENKRDAMKANLRKQLTVFTGAAIGYEVKTPGEFTNRNGEKCLEITLPFVLDSHSARKTRYLFFLYDESKKADVLWKIYDPIPLVYGGDWGTTFEQAVRLMEQKLKGDVGVTLKKGDPMPSYFGSLVQINQYQVWSDGNTQLRLVDHSQREDSSVRTIGLAFEDVRVVQRLPTYRKNIERRQIDPEVERVGASPTPTRFTK